MEVKTYITHQLVKGAALNHHGTLFAGRSAEWFVEAGFIATSSLTAPENTVCLKIHGMIFKKPVKKGTIVRFESKVVFAGRTKFITYVKMVAGPNDDFIVDGFLTFINVNEQGKPCPHGITIEAVTPEDKELQEKARLISKTRSL